MIQSLKIQNLILIETCTIHFHTGLNILSGETGAGKTAFIESLHLGLGKKADPSLIRKGSEKASVEAAFDIEDKPELVEFLMESGIECDPTEFLIIKREILLKGKSRSFINGQMVSTSLITKVAKHLVEIVSQSTTSNFFTSDHQTSILDLFGAHQKALTDYHALFENVQSFRLELEGLNRDREKKLREEQLLAMQTEEIENANLKAGEEQELVETHKQLINHQDVSKACTLALDALEDTAPSAQQLLIQAQTALSPFANIHPKVTEAASHLNQTLLSLQEASFLLNQFNDAHEYQPDELEQIERRLSEIYQLKKKYGQTIEEVQAFADECHELLDHFSHLEEKITQLTEQIETLYVELDAKGANLSQARKQAAARLEKKMKDHLSTLNMEKAQFVIPFAPKPPAANGCDQIQFLFSANPGIDPGPLHKVASGGELARIHLILKILLSEKEEIPILIFDEIDANIGGTTAKLVGEKLGKLASKRQVFCITHFPQVANFADHHFHVFKEERKGKSFAYVKLLDKEERKEELVRMMGGNALLANSI
ncbi:MAG: DNA repair protein RecN [Chlamydiia bacterium]|nr:DNA repair protein RecN [Chlamydiia bacterium]